MASLPRCCDHMPPNMLANDGGTCGRTTSSETPAIGRLGAVTGYCLLDLMHSGFLAHMELVSSAVRDLCKSTHWWAFSQSCSICSMQVTDLLTPMDAPTATGRSDRWVRCLKLVTRRQHGSRLSRPIVFTCLILVQAMESRTLASSKPC